MNLGVEVLEVELPGWGAFSVQILLKDAAPLGVRDSLLQGLVHSGAVHLAQLE